jgi:hypothetical protein
MNMQAMQAITDAMNAVVSSVGPLDERDIRRHR